MAPSTLDGGALSARPGGLPLEGGRAGAGVSEAGGLGRLGRHPRKQPLSFLPGVLLDIQQHFGVKDRGAGLLQSGEAPHPGPSTPAEHPWT